MIIDGSPFLPGFFSATVLLAAVVFLVLLLVTPLGLSPMFPSDALDPGCPAIGTYAEHYALELETVPANLGALVDLRDEFVDLDIRVQTAD
jgi:hypothetical protein